MTWPGPLCQCPVNRNGAVRSSSLVISFQHDGEYYLVGKKNGTHFLFCNSTSAGLDFEWIISSCSIYGGKTGKKTYPLKTLCLYIYK